MKRKKGSITLARASLRCNNKAKGKVDEADSCELYPYFDKTRIFHDLGHL